jgi:hypothetical protein
MRDQIQAVLLGAQRALPKRAVALRALAAAGTQT